MKSETKSEAAGVSKLRLTAALLVSAALVSVGSVNALGLSTRHPILLKALVPYSGVAAGNWVEVGVRTAQTVPNGAELRASALDVLRREPLDFRAARSIALADVLSKRNSAARSKFAVIARHTKREGLTHLWLMDDAYKRGEYGKFLDEAEIVMRVRPETTASIYALMTQMVDNGKIASEIARRVAARPEWRAGFLDAFGEKSTDSDAGYALFKQIKMLGAPASSSELRVWLLYELGRNGAARTTERWRDLRVEKRDLDTQTPRNGDLEGTTAPQPFDWTFFVPEDGYSEITDAPNGSGKSLYVEYSGRNAAVLARQVINLAPGRYSLTYSVFPLSDLARKDLRLGIDCAAMKGFSPVVSHAVVSGRDAWSRKEFQFVVPANCAAQQVTVGMQPDGLTSDLQAYFDDIRISPARSD